MRETFSSYYFLILFVYMSALTINYIHSILYSPLQDMHLALFLCMIVTRGMKLLSMVATSPCWYILNLIFIFLINLCGYGLLSLLIIQPFPCYSSNLYWQIYQSEWLHSSLLKWFVLINWSGCHRIYYQNFYFNWIHIAHTKVDASNFIALGSFPH